MVDAAPAVDEEDSASTLSSDAPARALIFRTTVWRDEQQGIEVSIRTRGGRTRRLAVSVNSQVLISTLLLNSTIVGAQFVGAWYANSLALLMDCSSMLVDVVSYAAAIWAECSPGGNSELIVSALSMLALWGVTCPAIVGALAVLNESRRHAELLREGVGELVTDGGTEVNPFVILGFGVAGLACDALALSCFLRQRQSLRAAPRAGKGDWGERRRRGHARRSAGMLSPVAAEPSLADGDGYGAGSLVVAHIDEGEGEVEAAAASELEHDRDAINMRSALAHVVADACRSLSTATAALLILVGGYEPRKTDAVCSLVVALFVLVASVGVCKLWCVLACADFRRLCGADPSRAERRAMASSDAALGPSVKPDAPAHELGLGVGAARPSPVASSPEGRFRRGRLVWHEAHGQELGGFRSARHDGR